MARAPNQDDCNGLVLTVNHQVKPNRGPSEGADEDDGGEHPEAAGAGHRQGHEDGIHASPSQSLAQSTRVGLSGLWGPVRPKHHTSAIWEYGGQVSPAVRTLEGGEAAKRKLNPETQLGGTPNPSHLLYHESQYCAGVRWKCRLDPNTRL